MKLRRVKEIGETEGMNSKRFCGAYQAKSPLGIKHRASFGRVACPLEVLKRAINEDQGICLLLPAPDRVYGFLRQAPAGIPYRVAQKKRARFRWEQHLKAGLERLFGRDGN